MLSASLYAGMTTDSAHALPRSTPGALWIPGDGILVHLKGGPVRPVHSHRRIRAFRGGFVQVVEEDPVQPAAPRLERLEHARVQTGLPFFAASAADRLPNLREPDGLPHRGWPHVVVEERLEVPAHAIR